MTPSRRWKLASRSPAPISSTNANATCATTSERRTYFAVRPDVPERPSSSEHAAQAHARELQRRHSADDDPKQQSGHERHREHHAVETDLVCPREICKADPLDGIESGQPEPDPERCAQDHEERGFGNELLREAAARRADGVARGELLHAAVRADEGEVGDVHRRDEHDEDDAAPEHLERRAHVANDVGLEGQERRAVAGIHEHVLERTGPLDVARVLRVDPRLGARERDARRQPQSRARGSGCGARSRPALPA